MAMAKAKALPLIFIIIWSVYACANIPPPSKKSPWPCNPQADVAVDAGDWETALLRHQEYLLENPTDCLAVYHLGYIYGRLSEREKEVESYKEAIACGYNQDDLLYFNLAMAYGELNQLDQAIQTFEQAVALNPGNADNYFGLGLTSHLAGHKETALAALAKAVTLDPKHWDARIEIARIYLDQGRLNAARTQLEAVQKGAPKHEELQGLWQIYADRKITVYDPNKK